MSGKNYSGIDKFRMIAALLIVAIHISPLASFSETGDFIVTRVIARVAVPFFFMTSGFFLISRYNSSEEKLKKFIKKTAAIYGIAICIYLPLNLYNNYFEMENLLPNILKDLVFDGTFYHLWYLPASSVGAWIAWHLVKKFDYSKALAAAGILYFIGLLGDSYYGAAEKIPFLRSFYNLIFQVSDYTRNGIFFAPVFFLFGGIIADSQEKMDFGKNIRGFGISFLLMFIEAMILRHFQVQRHDSMYLFLLPCMYFLFSVILQFRGKRRVWLRTSSLIIYIIHPMMIVAVRLAAKVLHLEGLLIENSLGQYIAVTLASVVFSMAVTGLLNNCGIGKRKDTADTARAYVEVDLNNLEHNVRTLKQAMQPGCELMAVVKAQAYGHGAYVISTHLDKMGVRAFAVATIDEGIQLRKSGIRGEILILGYTSPERVRELKKYDLTQTLADFDHAVALNRRGLALKGHIKIDTGMHRLGTDCTDVQKVRKMFCLKNIQVSGIFTHLCCADSLRPDAVAFTKKQISQFYMLLNALKDSGIAIPKVHIQSSYGLLNYPELQCSYVRAGIALYGVLSSPNDETVQKLDLRPVLSLKSRVVLVRQVERGETVGYARAFCAERDSRIAVISIGYADGYPRNLSCGKGYVMIRQQRVPVIGRICMDQLAVDITDTQGISVGDIATLISAQESDGLAAPTVAEESGSISNELLCRMGARLPVVVKRGRG